MLMIRSQDKEKLYPLTHGLYAYGNTLNMDLGGTIDDEKDVLLGEYETEFRCLEILDEIQREFQYSNHFSGSGISQSDCQNWEYGVYQMPEK